MPLQDPISQKDFIVCVLEFSLKIVRKKALILRSLHGRKTLVRDFSNFLQKHVVHNGLMSYPDNSDTWMRPALKVERSEHYECVLICIDSALAAI